MICLHRYFDFEDKVRAIRSVNDCRSLQVFLVDGVYWLSLKSLSCGILFGVAYSVCVFCWFCRLAMTWTKFLVLSLSIDFWHGVFCSVFRADSLAYGERPPEKVMKFISSLPMLLIWQEGL